MRLYFLKSLRYLIKLLRLGIIVFIIFLLIAFASRFVSNISQYPGLVKINSIGSQFTIPVIELVKKTIPYRYNGNDYSALITAIVMMLILRLFTVMQDNLWIASNKIATASKYNKWRKQMKSVVSEDKLVEMDKRFADISTSSKKGRKQLINEFAILKKQLDNMAHYMAFLSVDVVDSTGMKRDEDKYVSARDFDLYNVLVVKCLKNNGVIKYTLTPDGVMSCFHTTDEAVNAAKALIEELKDFNAHVKHIKRDFTLRCGINGGLVYIDDDIPLEQVSDRIIDIAGHMQKHAKPNCINIAGSAIEPLKHRGGFSETSNIVDEQVIYEWDLTPGKQN